MIDGGGAANDIELGPVQVPGDDRPLLLLDISSRLLLIEQEVEFCDVECDRAFSEVARLLRWIEGRLTRNGAFGGIK